jgi:tetratricopeptide (TPR) repeat protein
MKSHPQSELLQSFLTDLRTDEAGLVLHLVRCQACQVEAESALAPADQQGWTFAPRPRSEVDYESVWRRVASRQGELMERLRQERAVAAPLLGELLALPHPERLARIAEGGVDGHSLSLAHDLLEEARLCAGPERGELAQAVTAMLEAWDLEGGLAEDARAVDVGTGAWSEVGEAARAAGRLDEAERAFAKAVRFVTESADPVERAGYLCSLARLRRDQRRMDEAAGLLGRAARLYEEVGYGREHAAVLLERAALALDSGETLSALADLEQVGKLGRHLTPDFACRLIQGLAAVLLAMGRPGQALAAVEEGLRVFAPGWPADSREFHQILGLEQQLRQWAPEF